MSYPNYPGDGCDTYDTPAPYTEMTTADERMLPLSENIKRELRRLPIPYDIAYRVKMLLADAYDQGGRDTEAELTQQFLDSPESFLPRPRP